MIPPEALDDWVRGLSVEDRRVAILGLGEFGEELGGRPPVLPWTLTEERFGQRPAPAEAAARVPPGGPWRVAVRAETVPAAILQALLQDRYSYEQHVASAFVAVERPPGALRRRPWRWPYRVGLLGFAPGADDELRSEFEERHILPPPLVDVRRVEDEPGSVDVLVAAGPLDEALALLVRLQPVANAVVVLGLPSQRWALLDAQMATARAATAAVASALVPSGSYVELIHELVLEACHARPFDVALAAAARNEVLLWAEQDAIVRSALPEVSLRMASEASRAHETLAMAAPPELESASEELATAAGGMFSGESHEASTVASVADRVEAALDRVDEERWLQARVGEAGDNVVRAGENDVSVFVGPVEADALRGGGPIDETALPWEEEEADAFRLTVLFVQGQERPVQQQELELPRLGRSADVGFVLAAGADEQATARIVLLFRNRVLQTAALVGRVGEAAGLQEVAAVVPTLSGLDERRAFDVALLANHTNGVKALIRHSNGHSYVSAMPGLPAIADRIAEALAGATRVRPSKKGLAVEKARVLLVELARHGRDLFNELEGQLGALAGADRIQLVTTRGQWYLPLELVYTRYAPDDDAVLCPRYLDDPADCDGQCTPASDRKRLCPNAFWGLSKTIERQHYDASVEELRDRYLVLDLDRPRRGKRDLVIKRGVLGASERVRPGDRDATLAALGATAAGASSWLEWVSALKAEDTQLLVLLPHTDYRKVSLEIAADALVRGQIEAEHVTGDREVKPVVVLFGCRTTGKADDPAGFAARFKQKGARAVFHSSTDLLNVHATELARRLVAHLVDGSRPPQLLSDVVATFRRAAVHDGLLAALSVSAYGDADWRM